MTKYYSMAFAFKWIKWVISFINCNFIRCDILSSRRETFQVMLRWENRVSGYDPFFWVYQMKSYLDSNQLKLKSQQIVSLLKLHSGYLLIYDRQFCNEYTFVWYIWMLYSSVAFPVRISFHLHDKIYAWTLLLVSLFFFPLSPSSSAFLSVKPRRRTR